jgi:lipoprotein-releasing system permease protein
MSFELFIGGRYLRAKKRAFISLITYLSVAGVAVGVMALIVVIAVMSGFEADLKSRILGGQAQVILMRHSGPFIDYQEVMRRVEAVSGVEAATPFIFTQIMLRSSGAVSGAVLRGVEPATVGRVLSTLENVNLPEGRGAGEGEGPPPCRASCWGGNWPGTPGWLPATWSS